MSHNHSTITKSNKNGGPLIITIIMAPVIRQSLTFDFSILIDRMEMRFQIPSCPPSGPITSVILMVVAEKKSNHNFVTCG